MVAEPAVPASAAFFPFSSRRCELSKTNVARFFSDCNLSGKEIGNKNEKKSLPFFRPCIPDGKESYRLIRFFFIRESDTEGDGKGNRRFPFRFFTSFPSGRFPSVPLRFVPLPNRRNAPGPDPGKVRPPWKTPDIFSRQSWNRIPVSAGRDGSRVYPR